MPVTLLLLALAAPPAGPAVGPPRLAKGDELTYRGEVEEESRRVDNPFRKRHELEVRVFVFDAVDGTADCAVLTRIRTLTDPNLAGSATAVTGTDPRRALTPPAVRLDLVRIDPRGRAVLLAPPPAPRLHLDSLTPTRPVPASPPDAPPVTELGFLVPHPTHPVGIGSAWATADAGRPPVTWGVTREGVWNGASCLELTAGQQTDGWDTPAAAPTGWRRTETLLVAPSDGFAASVDRTVEHRQGVATVARLRVRYTLQPPARHLGGRYDDARREIEAAYRFAADLDPLLPAAHRTDPREFQKRLRKIDLYLEDTPAGGFREAVEAVRRRCAAALRGEAVAVASVAVSAPPAEPPAVGRPAPDFVAPAADGPGRFHLAAHRGRPVALVFFKPGVKTAPGALTVAEALHLAFPGRVAAVAIADPSAAARQREALKLGVPVYDGTAVRATYGVVAFPQFAVVDAAGRLAWRFDGYGPEVGYLAKQEMDRAK